MVFYQATKVPEQPPQGVVPSHKITVGEADDVTVYWYVQQPASALGFDPKKHRDLVELMHEKGKLFPIGGFESFTIGTQRNYHLDRIGPREFVVKSLR